MGGGLLVYVKSGLSILPYDKFCENSFNQFCCFKLVNTGEPLHFILVYRPPSSNIENLSKLCDMLANLDRNTFVIGDFNIPNVNWQDMAAGRDQRGDTTCCHGGGLPHPDGGVCHTYKR